MNIYIVRVSIDWHNRDTQDLTFAYDDKEKAVKRMKRETAEIKSALKRQEREIVWEEGSADSYSAESSAEDFVNLWVEKVELHQKK